MKLDGARVLVTGAGSGIGKATALRCARTGSEVIAVDINAETAEATAAECGGGAYVCDVSSREAVAGLAERVESEHGPVDVLVNNAGVGVAAVRGSSTRIWGSFAGTRFHSARWNHEHDLSGERVAVIGTGPAAAQFVPRIVERVQQLVVFQRTPPWVVPHPDPRCGAPALPARAAGPGPATQSDLRPARGDRRRLPGPHRSARADRGLGAGASSPPGTRSPAAREADTALPLRVQAADPLEHVLPGADRGSCGTGDRPDRARGSPLDHHA